MGLLAISSPRLSQGRDPVRSGLWNRTCVHGPGLSFPSRFGGSAVVRILCVPLANSRTAGRFHFGLNLGAIPTKPDRPYGCNADGDFFSCRVDLLFFGEEWKR